jgi:hypothetical protein
MAIKSFVDGLHVSPAWSHLNLTVHPLLLGAPRSTLSSRLSPRLHRE